MRSLLRSIDFDLGRGESQAVARVPYFRSLTKENAPRFLLFLSLHEPSTIFRFTKKSKNRDIRLKQEKTCPNGQVFSWSG